jgi:hypothetical protein
LAEIVSTGGDSAYSISGTPGLVDYFPKSIHQIARDGDCNAMSRLNSDHIANHINDFDEKKLTPMHYAARNGSMWPQFSITNALLYNRKSSLYSSKDTS